MTFGTPAGETGYDARPMDRPPPTRTLLFVAGLLAWGAIAQPFLLPLLRGETSLREPSIALSLGAHVAYLVAFVVCAARLFSLSPASRHILLAAQSLSALALIHMRQLWLEAGLIAIVAAEASLLLPRRRALLWVIAQTALVFPYYVGRADVAQAAFWTAGVLGFQLFAMTIGYLARHEAASRAEVSRVNAELRAAQVMLAEGARTAERLRIARELHDAVGHHLTAMSLHLELARHAAPENAAIAEAQGIAKSMLGEVRGVVKAMREEEPIDLPRALQALAAALPKPRVHLEISEDLILDDEAAAHALFRAAQEAMTNAARHGDAENLWITLSENSSGLIFEARDDGRGASSFEPGNGLSGLKERVEALSGALSVEAKSEKGFSLHITLPRRRGAP